MIKLSSDTQIGWPTLQLIRYGLVGVASNAANYLVYLLMTYFGVEPKIAMTLVFIVGASVGFVGNRKWTFAHEGHSSSAALRFLTAYATAYVLNLFSMWLAVDQMKIPHYLVQAVNLVVISALLFLAQKYWIFASLPGDENGQRVGDAGGRRG